MMGKQGLRYTDHGRFTLRMSNHLLEQVRRDAEQSGQAMTWVIENIVGEHYRRQSEK